MNNTNQTELQQHTAAIEARFHLTVLNEALASTQLAFTHPDQTGRSVVHKLGAQDPEQMVILRQVGNGEIVKVRLDEPLDLRTVGQDRFFVVVGDRTYDFVMDSLQLMWPRADVSSTLLLNLAHKSGDFEVVQELPDGAHRSLGEHESVSLAGAGVERFKTVHKPKIVTVFYRDDPVEIARGEYTTEQLVDIFKVPAGYLLEIVLPPCEFVVLKPGEKLRIHGGEKFVAHFPVGTSS